MSSTHVSSSYYMVILKAGGNWRLSVFGVLAASQPVWVEVPQPSGVGSTCVWGVASTSSSCSFLVLWSSLAHQLFPCHVSFSEPMVWVLLVLSVWTFDETT